MREQVGRRDPHPRSRARGDGVRRGRRRRRRRRAAQKPGRVAVVGAGLSGLSAAYELARKGYSVVVFEAQDRAGGRARDLGEDVLPEADLAADCARRRRGRRAVRAVHSRGARRSRAGPTHSPLWRPTSTPCTWPWAPPRPTPAPPSATPSTTRAGSPSIRSRWRPASRGPTAVAASCAPPSRGRRSPPSPTGDARRCRSTGSCSTCRSGRPAATRGGFATGLIVNLKGVESEPPVRAADAGARLLARQRPRPRRQRCLQCECLECVKACTYLEEYGAHPGLYARRIYNNLTVTQGRGSRSANRMIDSCSLCRLCYEVCPTDLDMAEVIGDAARREMVRQGRMPASAFDFAVQDLRLAVGERPRWRGTLRAPTRATPCSSPAASSRRRTRRRSSASTRT